MNYQKKTKPALWTVAFPPPVRPQRVAVRKVRKRIPTQSRVQRQRLASYRPKRDAFLAVNLTCERCGAVATCVHHLAGRRSNTDKEEYFRASCDACNAFAKNDPKAARAEGWIAPEGVYKT